MNIKEKIYSPSWHDPLLQYLCQVYPSRSKDYLNWWLTTIDNYGEDCWQKVVFIMDDSNIVGCTLGNKLRIGIDGTMYDYYTSGNTILNKEYRGKGLSKIFYRFVNSFDNWIRVGFTEIAFKIMPRYVANFTPLHPINVYISINK